MVTTTPLSLSGRSGAAKMLRARARRAAQGRRRAGHRVGVMGAARAAGARCGRAPPEARRPSGAVLPAAQQACRDC